MKFLIIREALAKNPEELEEQHTYCYPDIEAHILSIDGIGGENEE